MGNVGFAMPLLSTLAALVIIVHSAEEDYEQNYRELRPRSLDIDSPRQDQIWRMIEEEPNMKQSSPITHSDTWEDIGPEPPIPRRRPVRKRKRRPQLSIEDDLIPQGSYTYNNEAQPYLQDNGDRPRRRRKKIIYQNSNEDRSQEHSLSEENLNRPKGRRGQKRKRPLTDSWPELSEFGSGYRHEERNNSAESKNNMEIPYNNAQDDNESSHMGANDKIDSTVQIYNKNEQKTETTTPEIIDHEIQPLVPKNEEKFLSEFSIESMRRYKKPSVTTISNKEKIIDKVSLSNNIEQPKEKAPLDPFTLKVLLKKSNGKSLSEILQQNNLSLADLLHGREKALSVLKQESFSRTQHRGPTINLNTHYNSVSSIDNTVALHNKESSAPAKPKQENEHIEMETGTQVVTTRDDLNLPNKEKRQNNESEHLIISNIPQENSAIENSRRAHMRRRFSGGIRRKLRIRPKSNNNYKGQLSRDLIALTSLKYKNNRNVSKSPEGKEIIPSIMKTEHPEIESNIQIETESESITTTPCTFTDTTTQESYETTTDFSNLFMNTQVTDEVNNQTVNSQNSEVPYFETDNVDLAQFTTTTLTSVNLGTDKDIAIRNQTYLPILNPLMNSSDLRRQTFNNRLKRKRLKQSTSTTQEPKELKVDDTYGVDKLVSASEFIAKTQTRTSMIEDDDFETLDYMTTESQQKILSRLRSRRPLNTKNLTASPSINIERISTEDTAKIEIDEILNDNHTNSELTKILKERNMTINELIEHRERGSSHVHLADIFHNASKEPNPPEPFLSKSSIEPISKETYPLRALLEANIHDPKSTTIHPNSSYIKNINIPVVMDFGNNVNENGENLGIITVLNNLSETHTDKLYLNRENVKTSYDSSDKENFNNQDKTRQGRMYNSEKDSVTWNDVIALMQKNQKQHLNAQISHVDDSPISETLKKIAFDEDVDSDGLIILDSLQQLSNFDTKTSSDELLELKLYERNKSPQIPIMSNFVSNNTRSVTVATASIIGLGLILFLLTYVVLKWKQQSKIFQNKHAHEDDFVPTPVFESRKGHKINSSIRSKSPMLASSSVYAIDTIDTRAGAESPEYMWDTLRKPFQ